MYKDLKVWGRNFSLEVLFDVFTGEEVLPEQQKSLESFIGKADEILSDSSEIEKYCANNSNGEVTLPVDNIFKYVVPVQLFIKRETSVRKVALLCNYKFDEEAGCAIVFENEKLMCICTQEEVQFI